MPTPVDQDRPPVQPCAEAQGRGEEAPFRLSVLPSDAEVRRRDRIERVLLVVEGIHKVCVHTSPTTRARTCPFRSDVHEDDSPCICCDRCRRECQEDV